MILNVTEPHIELTVNEDGDQILININEGSAGLSAYEIAVANGFVGTEAEWLLSLQGAQGEDGVGVPAGGLEGQILAKASATNYDTEWIDNYATNIEQYVKNETGTTLYKGQVVYITGATGDNPTVGLAQANNETNSSKTIGFLKQNLLNGEHGYVITEGLIEGLNTNDAPLAGDPVWLSPTTAGGVVYGLANKPVAPNHMVYLGVVIRKQTNNGKIYVHVQNGFELQELHNVLITSVQNEDILQYESSSSLWKNKPRKYTYTFTSGFSFEIPLANVNFTINNITFYNPTGHEVSVFYRVSDKIYIESNINLLNHYIKIN